MTTGPRRGIIGGMKQGIISLNVIARGCCLILLGLSALLGGISCGSGGPDGSAAGRTQESQGTEQTARIIPDAIEEGDAAAGLDVEIRQAARQASEAGQALVHLEVTDELGKPAPCRVHWRDEKGQVIRAAGQPFWFDHFTCDGRVALTMAPGNYSYEIERGPEYEPLTGKLKVEAIGPAGKADPGAMSLKLQFKRISRMAAQGWYSGDLHIHRPPGDLPLLMKAEDLNIGGTITWWNNDQATGLPAGPVVAEVEKDRFLYTMGGEDERGGGALLYFHLDRPLPLPTRKPGEKQERSYRLAREIPSSQHFLSMARKLDEEKIKEQAGKAQPAGGSIPGLWVDVEKPFWWDMPMWIASGQVDSVGIANNHMNRDRVLGNEAWGRPRDRTKLPDPHGNGQWTLEIYDRMLEAGLRLPPSAGSASGVLPNPAGYNRVYVQVEGALSYKAWWEGLKAGRCFVTNGPLLICSAGGKWPGHVFKIAPGGAARLPVKIEVTSNDVISRIEILRNGRVHLTLPPPTPRGGKIELELEISEPGWFAVRAFAQNNATFRFASTGPFYVDAQENQPRISRAACGFFLNWAKERKAALEKFLPAERERDQVLADHQRAIEWWENRMRSATAD